MKKFLTFFFFSLICVLGSAQTDNWVSLEDLDRAKFIKELKEGLDFYTPRFKLYNTENIFTLIKLDTTTGALWLVQYETNTNNGAFETPIDDSSLLKSYDTEKPGRYELYPTKNMYTFILLDTMWGYTYQVQWSPKIEQRFRRRIYE